ncbi:MAG TPA: hypothetical protein VL979_04350 [Solirubrobacteraceae bacterium]|nr:hypothetical protein [Solirubrobacteraceae bacterium]
MRRLVLLILTLALVTPAPALASGQDAAATHALIAADYALARTRVATIQVAQAKVEQYDRKLAAECPNVGAGSPEDEAASPMSKEVAVALWSISYGAAAGPTERFAGAVKKLHWTNARFNRAVHAFATTLRSLATIQLPNLCDDVRTWTASGFSTVPPNVLVLDEHVEPLRIPDIPWGLVSSYERGDEASRVAYIKHGELKLAEAEFMLGQKDWYQVLETLGVAP